MEVGGLHARLDGLHINRHQTTGLAWRKVWGTGSSIGTAMGGQRGKVDYGGGIERTVQRKGGPRRENQILKV